VVDHRIAGLLPQAKAALGDAKLIRSAPIIQESIMEINRQQAIKAILQSTDSMEFDGAWGTILIELGLSSNITILQALEAIGVSTDEIVDAH
jgi:hypothetical protein